MFSVYCDTKTIIYALSVTINRDHSCNNLPYIKIMTNRDLKRPYSALKYGLLRSPFDVIFIYTRLLRKWSLFIVTLIPES